MRALDDFLSQVRIDVPHIALPIVRQAILDTCRDFIKGTHVWHYTKIISLAKGKSEYAIATPENTFIQDVTYFGRKVKNSNPVKYTDLTEMKSTEDDMDWEVPEWRNSTSDVASVERWGITSDRQRIFVYPRPNIIYNAGLKMKVIVAPNQDAFEVPDILYEEYATAIGAGTVASLLMLAPEEFTNMPLAERMALAKTKMDYYNKMKASCMMKVRTERKTPRFRTLGTAHFGRTFGRR